MQPLFRCEAPGRAASSGVLLAARVASGRALSIIDLCQIPPSIPLAKLLILLIPPVRVTAFLLLLL
ncbi:hypothetical protein [Caballeronia udeis]